MAVIEYIEAIPNLAGYCTSPLSVLSLYILGER